MKVRRSKSSIEAGLDEDTSGVGLRNERLYTYRRDKRGKYAKKGKYPEDIEIDPFSEEPWSRVRQQRREDYFMGIPGRYEPSKRESRMVMKDRMGFFDRDLRILVCIGTVVVVFILCYTLLNIVFDSLIDFGTAISIDVTNLSNFRVQASLVLGTVVAIIVGAGAAMFLFKEDEVNDSIFEA